MLTRRSFATFGSIIGAAALSSRQANALDYPIRPIRLIVGYAAGSGADIVARIIGTALSERMAQPIIIENRPGAATLIGTELVAKAQPDGYTLLFLPTAAVISAIAKNKPGLDIVRDIAPVAIIGDTPFALVINPSIPARTIPELIAYGKQNPDKINLATPGIGTASHVFGELFAMLAGIRITHVPYSGNYLPDLLSGQVQLAFAPTSLVGGFIKEGKLQALAITGPSRSAALPDVPAMTDFFSAYDARNWIGIGAPARTPAEIIERLNREIRQVCADPAIRQRFAPLDLAPMDLSAREFGDLIARDINEWTKVIKSADIKID